MIQLHHLPRLPRLPWELAALGALAALLAASAMMAAEPPADPNATLTLTVGRSMVVKTPWPLTRVSVTDPKIADVKGISSDQILVIGKACGSTDLMIWNQKEELWQRRVDVVAAVGDLQRELRLLWPSAALEVRQSQDILVLTGRMERAEQAEQVHRFLDAAKVRYVDLTRIAGVQQVQLQVRVAEVSRSAMRTLGFNGVNTGKHGFYGQTIGPAGGGPINPISVGVPSGASATAAMPFQFTQGMGVSPAVTLFGGFPDINLQMFIQALAENQYLRILAEPTLVALSGEQASFLAGGEFPIPVAQNGSGGSGSSITLEYKEFGVRLKFRPTVLGDNSIRLFVAPEVSELSDVGAVTIQGFRVPGIVTRRAETTLELKSGQSFAMAGLISRMANGRSSRVPGLGDVPVLGALFRSVRYSSDETELMVLVTASLVEPLAKNPPAPGITHVTPNDWELYAMGHLEGQGAARLSPQQATWLNDSGLSKLRGPGGWATLDAPPAATSVARAKGSPQ